MMDQQALTAFLQTLVPQLVAASTAAAHPPREARERRMLEEKMFQRMDKFGGDEKMYKEWEYNLRVILSSGSYKFGVALEAVDQFSKALSEETSREMKFEFMNKFEEDSDEQNEMDKFWDKGKAELFNQLCLITTWEANLLVRGSPSQDGFVAMKRLQERYNGRSPARMLQKLLGIIRPTEIKGIKAIPLAIDDWEARIKDIVVEYQEDIPEKFKVAI